MVTRMNTDTSFGKKTFPNMDLDLSTYVFHYDKEKNLSLNHDYFEVMAEESYRNPRKCDGPTDRRTVG